MRYRKENGQWKEVTPIGASKEEVNEIKQDLTQLSNNISDAWQSGKTYSVGEYCIYNNELWKCLVANNTEPTEGANWHKTNVGSEIDGMFVNETYDFRGNGSNLSSFGRLQYIEIYIGKSGYVPYFVSLNDVNYTDGYLYTPMIVSDTYARIIVYSWRTYGSACGGQLKVTYKKA